MHKNSICTHSIHPFYYCAFLLLTELEYADYCQKDIVPIMMQRKFKPSKWLGFLLVNKFWYDLSNPDTYEESLFKFFQSIKSAGRMAKLQTDE